MNKNEITRQLSQYMGGGQVEMRWGRGGREKDKKESSECRDGQKQEVRAAPVLFYNPGTIQ